MVDRFWEELEWDFQAVLRVDVNDWLRGERDWRQFYRFRQRLPQGGAYWAKKFGDRDLAQELWDALPADKRKPTPAGPPDLFGWSSIAEALADIKDQLILVRVASTGSGSDSVKFTKRPVPAFEKLRREYKTGKLGNALSQLLPHDPTYKEFA